MMDSKARTKITAALAAERDELERRAAEREKQAQRLSGPQKNAALLEARSLRQQAKEVGRRAEQAVPRTPPKPKRRV
jgi:hypothetical protein